MRSHWHTNYTDALSWSEGFADRVAGFIGSWKFLMIQSGIFAVWVAVNTLYWFNAVQWDPYPYILFNLFMSAEAAYSTPLIMMSQNRQSIRDRHQADVDYQTNIDAKEEIEALQRDIARIEEQKLDRILALLEKAG